MNKPVAIAIAAAVATPFVLAGIQIASSGVADVLAAARKGKDGDKLLAAPDWKTQSTGLTMQRESIGNASFGALQTAGGAALIGAGLAAAVYAFARLT